MLRSSSPWNRLLGILNLAPILYMLHSKGHIYLFEVAAKGCDITAATSSQQRQAAVNSDVPPK